MSKSDRIQPFSEVVIITAAVSIPEFVVKSNQFICSVDKAISFGLFFHTDIYFPITQNLYMLIVGD